MRGVPGRFAHPLWALVAALALTVPWLVVYALGGEGVLSVGPQVLVSGLAVLGAAFLLAWGAETAEKDVPRAFAIAVLAVLAVAPEYAVDALYAWTAGAQAGTERGIEAGNLAVANMTGANRILIGIGWSGVALFTIVQAWRGRPDVTVAPTDRLIDGAVRIDRDLSLEIFFLSLATLWAFLVPLSGGIGIVDTILLVGIYVVYILVVVRGDVEEVEDQVGVPKYLQARPFPHRTAASIALFVFSGFLIFTAVEPFAHGLEVLGTNNGIPEFFMIQWIAPLASESPELIVVVYLVNKARSTAAFNALISSKLNQWTLLIGTLAVVYSVALGRYGTLPFDFKQSAEIWITAAQSAFAIAILVNFRISVKESLALLVLFLSQVVVEFGLIRTMSESRAEYYSIRMLLLYTAIYLLLTAVLLARRGEAIREILDRSTGTIREALRPSADEAEVVGEDVGRE